MRTEWNIRDLLTWTTGYFQDKGIPQPRLEAEVLLAHALEKDRVYLYTAYDAPVDRDERDRLRGYIQRRIKHEPVAYITGYKEFMSLPFRVTPEVLIPRPETELLVEKAIELTSEFSDEVRICDVGTGSGAIAVSLAYYLPRAVITAVDINIPSLEVARCNADINKVNIQLYHGDLLSPLEEETLNLIVANLPYISEQEYLQLEPGVKEYEPSLALKGGKDGLDVYRRLLPQALAKLDNGGYLLMEISPHQSTQIHEITCGFNEVEIIKDLSGHDRIVKARKGQ